MSATPRTDAARARCGFADMAKMERELAEALKERDLARERGFEMADVLERTERELAEASEKIATLATAAKNIALAYDPRYFRAGKWAVEALAACQIIATDAGTEKSEPKSMAESWQAFMRAGDAIFAKPKPSTFEAHGHTWTRHKPGDPCPVPGNAMVHVIYGTLHQMSVSPVKAADWNWSRTTSVVGWRYALKPLPPEMKVSEWVEKPLPPPALPGVRFITRTAADCGQYADKHLAPAPSSTSADTPEALQNQGLDMVSPSGIEPETL